MDKNGIPERLQTLRYPVYTRKKNNECDKLEFVKEDYSNIPQYFYLHHKK